MVLKEIIFVTQSISPHFRHMCDRGHEMFHDDMIMYVIINDQQSFMATINISSAWSTLIIAMNRWEFMHIWTMIIHTCMNSHLFIAMINVDHTDDVLIVAMKDNWSCMKILFIASYHEPYPTSAMHNVPCYDYMYIAVSCIQLPHCVSARNSSKCTDSQIQILLKAPGGPPIFWHFCSSNWWPWLVLTHFLVMPNGLKSVPGNASKITSQIFRIFDRDGNDFLDFKEFLMAIDVANRTTGGLILKKSHICVAYTLLFPVSLVSGCWDHHRRNPNINTKII